MYIYIYVHDFISSLVYFLKADLLRFNSFEVDQKSVLIHPRFMSP